MLELWIYRTEKQSSPTTSLYVREVKFLRHWVTTNNNNIENNSRVWTGDGRTGNRDKVRRQCKHIEHVLRANAKKWKIAKEQSTLCCAISRSYTYSVGGSLWFSVALQAHRIQRLLISHCECRCRAQYANARIEATSNVLQLLCNKVKRACLLHTWTHTSTARDACNANGKLLCRRPVGKEPYRTCNIRIINAHRNIYRICSPFVFVTFAFDCDVIVCSRLFSIRVNGRPAALLTHIFRGVHFCITDLVAILVFWFWIFDPTEQSSWLGKSYAAFVIGSPLLGIQHNSTRDTIVAILLLLFEAQL